MTLRRAALAVLGAVAALAWAYGLGRRDERERGYWQWRKGHSMSGDSSAQSRFFGTYDPKVPTTGSTWNRRP